MPRRWRRLSALWLAAFLIAVHAAPHHHLNPIADLVSDGPSNSGRFAQIDGALDLDLGFCPSSLVDDESCLACFSHDFTASPASLVVLTPIFAPLHNDPSPPRQVVPERLPADTSSRAPPALL